MEKSVPLCYYLLFTYGSTHYVLSTFHTLKGDGPYSEELIRESGGCFRYIVGWLGLLSSHPFGSLLGISHTSSEKLVVPSLLLSVNISFPLKLLFHFVNSFRIKNIFLKRTLWNYLFDPHEPVYLCRVWKVRVAFLLCC